jgi:hypothetical protein
MKICLLSLLFHYCSLSLDEKFTWLTWALIFHSFVGESIHDDGGLVFAYYKEGATDPTFLYSAPMGWRSQACHSFPVLGVTHVVPIFVLVNVEVLAMSISYCRIIGLYAWTCGIFSVMAEDRAVVSSSCFCRLSSVHFIIFGSSAAKVARSLRQGFHHSSQMLNTRVYSCW